jgi:hypothetical protein
MHSGFSITLLFSLGNASQRIVELIIVHTVLSSRRRFFGSYMEFLTLLLEFPSVIITKTISRFTVTCLMLPLLTINSVLEKWTNIAHFVYPWKEIYN